jgi:hypothetical protein
MFWGVTWHEPFLKIHAPFGCGGTEKTQTVVTANAKSATTRPTTNRILRFIDYLHRKKE